MAVTMTGPIPTRDGDIVVSHQDARLSLYAVWRVVSDAQQACGETGYTAQALGRLGALGLATLMAAERRGAVFFLDWGSGDWTKIDH